MHGVWIHWRAIVNDGFRSTGEIAAHYVEHDPGGAGVLKNHIFGCCGVVDRGDLLEIDDDTVLMDDAFWCTSCSGGVADH